MRVAVARDNEDAVSLGGTSRGEGRENVVGLVVLLGDRRHAHGVQSLLQKGHLPNKLGWGLAPSALVLGVLPRTERVARDVERDRQVCGFLVLEQQDQHRQEPMDGVRVLALAVDKTVDGKRVESAEGERVAINDQEGRLF